VPPPPSFHVEQIQVDATVYDDLRLRRRKILDVSSIASSLPIGRPMVARPAAVACLVSADTNPRDINSTSVSDAPIRYPFSIPVSETII